MYDLEKITKMIKDVEKYFADLESFGLNEKTVEDTETFYASSMVMFGILNRMVDLGEEIIIKNDFGMPQNYQEYFEVLNKNGIIGKELAEELKGLVKDRNVLAHQYFDVKDKEILKMLKRVYSVKKFIERIKKEVGRERS